MLNNLEHRMFEFVAGYIQDTGGVSPSYNEIRDALRLRSKNQIGFVLDRLENKGKLRRLGHRARAIEIVSPHAPKPVVTYRNAAYFTWDEGSQGLKPWQADQKTS